MARELVDMAQRALDSPLLPKRLQSRKTAILAFVNHVASNYCGADKGAKAKFVRRAKALDHWAEVLRVKDKLMGIFAR